MPATRVRAFGAALLLAGLAGSAGAETPAAIQRDDVEEELSRRGGHSAGGDTWQQALDDLVERRLRAAAAIEAGYAENPEIRDEIERLLAARFERDHLQPLLAAIEVTDDEVAARYAETPEQFATAEQVRVALIRLASWSGGLRNRVADVADQIRRGLVMERRAAVRDAFHAELRQRFDVEIDARAAQPPAGTQAPTPPSLPADHGSPRN